MRAKAEETRERLEKMKAALLKRKDLLRVVVAEKALKHQAKRAQLQENNLQVCEGERALGQEGAAARENSPGV